MKRFITILLAIGVLLLFGCQNGDTNGGTDVEGTPSGEIPGGENDLVFISPDTIWGIEVRSIEELNQVKHKLSCSDEEFKEYFGYRMTKENLAYFLDLVDSIPYVPIVDGDIVWINYCYERTIDSGKYVKSLIISTESKNGEWTRFSYMFSISDEPDVDEPVTTPPPQDATVFTPPILSDDGEISVFAERRGDHPSGTGDFIEWYAHVDGIYTVIYYYVPDADQVDTSELFGQLSVGRIDTTIEDYFYSEGIYDGYGTDGGKAWGELPDSDGNAVPDAQTAISIATEQLEREQAQGRYQGFVLSSVFYDTEDHVWVVDFIEPPLVPGGSYHVAIWQKTGEILAAGYWGE